MPSGPALPDLRDRRLEGELMDGPDVEPARHGQALRALARVNALSLTVERLWREVRRISARVDGPVRVLDLACGGGDVAIGLARRATRAGSPVTVLGIDRSPFAVSWARAQAERARVEVTFRVGDVLAAPLPTGFHLATSSLFLHHLDEASAGRLLRAMAEAADRVFVQDLRRSRTGLALAWGALRVLTRSPIARVDGIRSVRAAFTVPEVEGLARSAGLDSASISRAWPQRLVLRWPGDDA